MERISILNLPPLNNRASIDCSRTTIPLPLSFYLGFDSEQGQNLFYPCLRINLHPLGAAQLGQHQPKELKVQKRIKVLFFSLSKKNPCLSNNCWKGTDFKLFNLFYSFALGSFLLLPFSISTNNSSALFFISITIVSPSCRLDLIISSAKGSSIYF
jgi:hypothetical protein